MIFPDWVRWTVWGVGLPIIVFLLWRILLRIRAINERIIEVRKEQEQNALNPYAAYAQLLEAQQLLDEARGKKKK